MLEALRTGGVGAISPLISRSVEASRQATSDAMRTAGSNLATANLGATPFGQSAVLSALTAANQRTAAIAPELAFQYASAAPGVMSAQTNAALQALSAYGSSQAHTIGGYGNFGLKAA